MMAPSALPGGGNGSVIWAARYQHQELANLMRSHFTMDHLGHLLQYNRFPSLNFDFSITKFSKKANVYFQQTFLYHELVYWTPNIIIRWKEKLIFLELGRN